MNSSRHFDFIIVGGGAAGLSLAYRLSLSPLHDRKVLILDKTRKDTNDKTWCFWSEQELDLPCENKMVWGNLSFFSSKFCKTHSIAPYKYYGIHSIDFYQKVLGHLEKFPSYAFQQSVVEDIVDQGTHVRVETSEGVFTGNRVFDSRLSLPASSPKHPLLFQQFAGWWIETPQAVFDPSSMVLMDFRGNTSEETTFAYILPLSHNRALVEHTQFTKNLKHSDVFKEELEIYLKERLFLKSYKILDREAGIIPMSTAPFPMKKGDRIHYIGAAAGLTKASTGYTFHAIQQDAQLIVNSLVTGKKEINRFKRKARFRFYDSLLLHILYYRGQWAEKIFAYMFQHNSFRLILKFLDEKTHLGEEILFFLRLPWLPFLQACTEKGGITLKKWLWHTPKTLNNQPSSESWHVPKESL